mgnify:CR=1 FL=1
MLSIVTKFVNLPPESALQASELLRRLENAIFSVRPDNSTRRQDGEVIVSKLESSSSALMQIRLNAYSQAKSAVINLKFDDSVKVTGLMVRDRIMGGDDRGLIAIAQRICATDLPVAENLIFGACQCVARGSVLVCESTPTEGKFQLYLPSIKPLPQFGPNFELLGVPSLY